MFTNKHTIIISYERDDRREAMFIEKKFTKSLHDILEMFFKKNYLFLENKRVKRDLAPTVAELGFTLEHEEFKLANMLGNPENDEHSEEYKTNVYRIVDMKDEYLDLRRRMYVRCLLNDTPNSRRCVFHCLSNPVSSNLTLDFIHTYNKWTEFTADYYITTARMQYDLKMFQQLIDGANSRNKITMFQEAKNELAAEYDDRIADSQTQLSNYKSDLQEMAIRLCNEYGLLKKLQSLLLLGTGNQTIYYVKNKKFIQMPIVSSAVIFDRKHVQQSIPAIALKGTVLGKKMHREKKPFVMELVGDTPSITVNAQKCDVIIGDKVILQKSKKKK